MQNLKVIMFNEEKKVLFDHNICDVWILVNGDPVEVRELIDFKVLHDRMQVWNVALLMRDNDDHECFIELPCLVRFFAVFNMSKYNFKGRSGLHCY